MVGSGREFKEFNEFRVFKDFSLISLISLTSLNSLTISSQICTGTKNRTREDGGGDGLVGIAPFHYFMRGYEKLYP